MLAAAAAAAAASRSTATTTAFIAATTTTRTRISTTMRTSTCLLPSLVAAAAAPTTTMGYGNMMFPAVSVLPTTVLVAAAFGIRSSSNNNNGRTFGHPLSSSSSAALFATSSSGGGGDPPFTSWTFDKACATMEWNAPVEATLSVKAVEDRNAVGASQGDDLILIGVMAPPKDEEDQDEDDDDNDEGGDDDDEEPPQVVLTGVAKVFDDEILGGALSNLAAEQAKTFKNGAKMGATTPTLRSAASAGETAATSQRYVMVGLGTTPKTPDDDPFDAKTGFTLGKTIANKCHGEKKVAKCSVFLPPSLASNATIVRDLSTAFYQTLYSDNRFRTGAKVKLPAEDLEQVRIWSELTTTDSDEEEEALNSAVQQGRDLATGVILTKDIVNAPHNVLNSQSLADTARRIAEQSPGRCIKCTILNKKECEKRGMGAYLGVARGSETEPQFIHLTYTPPSSAGGGGGAKLKKLGVVGKGLLFDTGGYNIKTQMMELMKFDCGGSAATLGAARAIGALRPEGVEVHFIVAACENMISDRAYVASDILTASNGKTIEVMNTDAEGRLTLADALVYADKEVGCEEIIELSTLTGACMVSLGKELAGVWTSDDDLAAALQRASAATGDQSWRMPLVPEYKELLDSKFADMKNVGGKYGGAITAALFLQQFVRTKKTPFAHIDIAGPVWNDKTGATGYGAKLICNWICQHQQQQQQQGE